MRGLNKLIISGNVSGDINYATLPSGGEVLSFSIASDRRSSGGGVLTVWVRINVFMEPLVRICRERLVKGGYVLVEGELMNRDGNCGRLTEVRAWEIIFVPKAG